MIQVKKQKYLRKNYQIKEKKRKAKKKGEKYGWKKIME